MASSSCATLVTTMRSSLSSDSQMGIGVPQYLLLLIAQSRALSSQFWKRFSLTNAGTQYVCALAASKRSRIVSTLTNQLGTACSHSQRLITWQIMAASQCQADMWHGQHECGLL